MSSILTGGSGRTNGETPIFVAYPKHIPVWIEILLIFELLVCLALHARQYEHLLSVKRVPEIITRMGNEMFTEVDLEISRKIGMILLCEYALSKAYTVFISIMVIHFNLLTYVWTLGQQLSPVWPSFLHPVTAWNMSFAVVLYAACDILKVPLILYSIYQRGTMIVKNSNGEDCNIISYHLRKTITGLIPTGIVAGLLTAFLQQTERQTLAMQICIVGGLSCLFFILYPILEIWCLLEELKELETPHSENFGTYKSHLHELCDVVGFPRWNVIIEERVPIKSSASAFYFGYLFYKRIGVFFKTSDDSHDPPSRAEVETFLSVREVEALLAHELGHWYHFHDTVTLIWQMLHLSTALLVYSLHSSPTILLGFGFRLDDPSKGGVGVAASFAELCIPGVVIMYCLVLRSYYNTFEGLWNAHSQACEREADYFAASLGYETDIAKSLIKLDLQDRKFPSSDPLYSMFYHSHPCLVERLQQLHTAALEMRDLNMHVE